MEEIRTRKCRKRKEKKTEFSVYKREKTDTFLKLTEKTEFIREDNTKLIREINFIIKHNGNVKVFARHIDFSKNGKIIFNDNKEMDSFWLPNDELKLLKKFIRKDFMPDDISYFKRNNDLCYTKCVIQWYTGFRNTPIKKLVNDFEYAYPYILSILRPFTKLDRLHLSNLGIVRENIV